jgi:rSAM/selenodomain-associated transferase 1
MKDTVIVFARAPRLGAVKRRLAREIGDRAALRFHRRTLDRLLHALAVDRRFRTVLALTPERAHYRPPRSVLRVPQGHGDLGLRMHSALSRFRRGKAVLLGSDIPDAGRDDVVAALRALGRADAAFGPACDGGFWLVALGARRPSRPFAGARWSSPHALSDTLANFRGRRVAMLRRLRDVDHAEDMKQIGFG